ncbi:phage major capsid protein [Alkalibaculum sp. M08DMB]|uniref:Phage major capsid protein n=1 Tax=Alkalibaculum sporogenes TaxID=2655001 RepID=A0A6A7KAI8_9FIRM|nr:phage major capsid protein [Alkalibaculum sporogenes]MPW26406.1 phage major capsid protein [Alkalibaculum sporogenes]
MINLEKNEKYLELVKEINEAPGEQKSEKIVEAMHQLIEANSSEIVSQYKSDFNELQANKENATKMGLRTLTVGEKEFYNKVFSPQQSITVTDINIFPETTSNFVFEEIKTSHDLLKYFKTVPAGVNKFITSEYTGKVLWGELTDAITSEISATIKGFNVDAYKLSGFMYVPEAILDLGPEWIDRYVRTVLIEVLEDGIEEGSVIGTGEKGPIGLVKSLSGAVDGVHPNKTPVALTSFKPEDFAPKLIPLTNGGKRKLGRILLVVNPADRLGKVIPASTVFTNGNYQSILSYINVEIIESAHVPTDRMVAFLPESYQMGLTKVGVQFSNDFKFLDHVRTYRTIAYGNGRIINDNMSIVFDISGLTPFVQPVSVEGIVQTQEVVG